MSVSSPSKNLVVHLHQHKPIVSCRVPSTLATMLDTRPTAESIEFLVSHMDHTGQGGPPYPAMYPATLNDDEDLRALTGEVEQHAQGQKPAGPTGPQGGGSMPLGAPLMGDGKGNAPAPGHDTAVGATPPSLAPTPMMLLGGTIISEPLEPIAPDFNPQPQYPGAPGRHSQHVAIPLSVILMRDGSADVPVPRNNILPDDESSSVVANVDPDDLG